MRNRVRTVAFVFISSLQPLVLLTPRRLLLSPNGLVVTTVIAQAWVVCWLDGFVRKLGQVLLLSLHKREAWGIRDVEPPASRPRARKTWRFPSEAVGFQVLSFIFPNQGLYTVWTQPVVQGGLFFFFFCRQVYISPQILFHSGKVANMNWFTVVGTSFSESRRWVSRRVVERQRIIWPPKRKKTSGCKGSGKVRDFPVFLQDNPLGCPPWP